MTVPLKAPFPWFGGKSRVAHIVWDYFGDVRNYVEPFAGSLAVLLGRPHEAKIETVNDADAYLSNFWRAIINDPERVAYWADWPVNEADLHSRHLYLVGQADFVERMKTDPFYCDALIAGWWVWGISQWIGSGWCCPRKERRSDGALYLSRPNLSTGSGVQANRQSPPGDPWLKRPNLGDEGRGVHRELITPGRTNAGRHAHGIHGSIYSPGRGNAGREPAGIHGTRVHRKRPRLGAGGRGVTRHQIPDLSGDSGAAGRGIHASALERLHSLACDRGGIYAWFYELHDRLRSVRVCCGDWKRILGPAPTTCIATTGVFLDPPYAVDERSDVYNHDSRDIAHDVREWAIANGDNPELRIALCGYDGEHKMPEAWTEIAWKANGGFANQKREGTQGKQNAHRERIWFSPHCLQPQGLLF